MTKEQQLIGQDYSDRVCRAINDPEEFDKIMEEFEAWKIKEGITL